MKGKEISRLFLYHFSPSYAMMKITMKFKDPDIRGLWPFLHLE